MEPREDGVVWTRKHRMERIETHYHWEPGPVEPLGLVGGWVEQHVRTVVELDYVVHGAPSVAWLPVKTPPCHRPAQVTIAIINGEVDDVRVTGPEIQRGGRDSNSWSRLQFGAPGTWPSWLQDLVAGATREEQGVAHISP